MTTQVAGTVSIVVHSSFGMLNLPSGNDKVCLPLALRGARDCELQGCLLI